MPNRNVKALGEFPGVPIKVVIFDFDLTLSVEHVFNFLSQAPPAASSEGGQLARIPELDQRPDYCNRGGFASVVMGGADRIAMLRKTLALLQSSSVDCLVCTRGLVGPVRKLLDQIGLLSYFSDVYGNTGRTYGMLAHDYVIDMRRMTQPGQDEHFLGSPENQIPGSKQKFVQGYMDRQGLKFSEVLFVDDTLLEVQNMQETCRIIHVTTAGMDAQICAQICWEGKQETEADAEESSESGGGCCLQ